MPRCGPVLRSKSNLADGTTAQVGRDRLRAGSMVPGLGVSIAGWRSVHRTGRSVTMSREFSAQPLGGLGGLQHRGGRAEGVPMDGRWLEVRHACSADGTDVGQLVEYPVFDDIGEGP